MVKINDSTGPGVDSLLTPGGIMVDVADVSSLVSKGETDLTEKHGTLSNDVMPKV